MLQPSPRVQSFKIRWKYWLTFYWILCFAFLFVVCFIFYCLQQLTKPVIFFYNRFWWFWFFFGKSKLFLFVIFNWIYFFVLLLFHFFLSRHRNFWFYNDFLNNPNYFFENFLQIYKFCVKKFFNLKANFEASNFFRFLTKNISRQMRLHHFW